MELFVTPSGMIRCLYDEAISLNQLGDASLHRASHVDPDQNGQWWADLKPSNGPRLGPFLTRSAALVAEAAWLTRHVLGPTQLS